MELGEHIQFFIDRQDLVKLIGGNAFFAIRYNTYSQCWGAGYMQEWEDYSEWANPIGTGLTAEEAIADCYAKYNIISSELIEILVNLKKPSQFMPHGEYRYVKIIDSGVSVKKLVYINDSYAGGHKFFLPNGDMLHVNKKSSLWANVFEVI